MSLEYTTLVLPLDDDQQALLDAKAAEGWQMVPGVKPFGVWMLCRAVAGYMAENKGFGTFHIDDSKIFILRNGKLLDGLGNEVPAERARELGIDLP
jgi:hypothetical protein